MRVNKEMKVIMVISLFRLRFTFNIDQKPDYNKPKETEKDTHTRQNNPNKPPLLFGAIRLS